MKKTNPSSPKPTRRSPTRRQKPPYNDEIYPALRDEIERLMVMAARVDEMFDEDRPLADLLRATDVLGKNATRILTLLKAQKELEGENDALSELHKALAEMIEDMEKQPPP